MENTISKQQDIDALITASEMYPELEKLALSAETEAFFSFRIFDPNTALYSDEAKELGLENWAELITHISGNGIKVRMVTSDFDPLFTPDLHRDSYHGAKLFSETAKGDVQVITALHGTRVGAFWKSLFYIKIRHQLHELRENITDVDTPALKKAKEGSWNLFPVTLHQKFAVIDGQRGIIGGIDVNPRRYDTPAHDRKSPETWHDISVRIEGEFCNVLRNHFIKSWDAALIDDANIFGEAADPFPEGELRELTEIPDLKLLRTVSRPQNGPFTFGPNERIHENETALIERIGKAEQFIYLETQFLRHFKIAKAIADRAKQAPELNVVLLCPTKPERMLFHGDDGFDARHAQSLQVKCLDHIRQALGDRFAVVSPAKPQAASDTKGNYLDADIVYVHAKVSIFDDRWAVVGSANLNGRSLRWDTEAAVLVDRPEFAKHLRERLAKIWFDELPDGPLDKATTWAERAKWNSEQKPDNRKGFLLPYPKQSNRGFSIRVPILPDEMF